MREIQEKAIRIALQCYGNGCLSDEDFIDLLKAIFDKDLTKINFNTGLVTTPGFAEPKPKLETQINYK